MKVCDSIIAFFIAMTVFELGWLVCICKADEVKAQLTISVTVYETTDVAKPFMVEVLTDNEGHEFKRLSY